MIPFLSNGSVHKHVVMSSRFPSSRPSILFFFVNFLFYSLFCTSNITLGLPQKQTAVGQNNGGGRRDAHVVPSQNTRLPANKRMSRLSSKPRRRLLHHHCRCFCLQASAPCLLRACIHVHTCMRVCVCMLPAAKGQIRDIRGRRRDRTRRGTVASVQGGRRRVPLAEKGYFLLEASYTAKGRRAPLTGQGQFGVCIVRGLFAVSSGSCLDRLPSHGSVRPSRWTIIATRPETACAGESKPWTSAALCEIEWTWTATDRTETAYAQVSQKRVARHLGLVISEM